MEKPRARALAAAVLAAALPAVATWGGDWPQWRGPARNGVSPERDLPVRWTATENVVWKLPLPGRSGSTPIVSGDRVFLNVADGAADRPLVRRPARPGRVSWKRPLGRRGHAHRKHNMSSPSPVAATAASSS